MVIGRQLHLALLISFIWHLFWMSFITIVFLPGKFEPSRYSSVCFLGSILKSPVSTRSPVGEQSGQGQISLPFKRTLIRPGFREGGEASFAFERETLNPDSFIDVDEPIGKVSPAATFVSAKTTARQRELLYQPPLSIYPEWTQQELKAEFVAFRIYISAKGLVEQVINVQASGNPEIDAALARYIERWRFAPAPGPQGQWQTVEISTD